MSAQLGLRAAASDEELTRLWERGMKDVTAVAFNPHDGDTVTIFVYSDLIWPNMTAWQRATEIGCTRCARKAARSRQTKGWSLRRVHVRNEDRQPRVAHRDSRD